MCGSAKKDSRSRTDKLLSAISLNLGGGTDNLTRWEFCAADGKGTLTGMNPPEDITTAEHAEPAAVNPDERARATEDRMTDDERFSLLVSVMGVSDLITVRDERIPDGTA